MPQHNPKLTFVYVLEQVLEQMRGARDLEVDMAPELSKQRQTVRDDIAIRFMPPTVLDTAFTVDHCGHLQWFWVVETAPATAGTVLSHTVL